VNGVVPDAAVPPEGPEVGLVGAGVEPVVVGVDAAGVLAAGLGVVGALAAGVLTAGVLVAGALVAGALLVVACFEDVFLAGADAVAAAFPWSLSACRAAAWRTGFEGPPPPLLETMIAIATAISAARPPNAAIRAFLAPRDPPPAGVAVRSNGGRFGSAQTTGGGSVG
jgi:hypothetical protein